MMVETRNLDKRYGRRWALRDCSLALPPGAVVGLVGPNGAGKSTLLQLIVGLLRPTAGTIGVLGLTPEAAMRSGRVAFVAQDAPTYASLSVDDHLRLGAGLNRGRWDAAGAAARLDRLKLARSQRAGRLSGGQRAQLALTLACSKRPDLLVLDEPVASLDPLARRAFLDETAVAVRESGTAVILSSHLVADLAHLCDHLVVLADARIQLAGPIADPDDLERVVLDQLRRAAA